MAEITLKVPQIIEALNRCAADEPFSCENCPMKPFPTNDCEECARGLMAMAALALTKTMAISDEKEALKAENKTLMAANAELENEKRVYEAQNLGTASRMASLEAKADAYEDMASRLISMVSTHMHTLLLEAIGNEG